VGSEGGRAAVGRDCGRSEVDFSDIPRTTAPWAWVRYTQGFSAGQWKRGVAGEGYESPSPPEDVSCRPKGGQRKNEKVLGGATEISQEVVSFATVATTGDLCCRYKLTCGQTVK
jgi:hypothetical protein